MDVLRASRRPLLGSGSGAGGALPLFANREAWLCVTQIFPLHRRKWRRRYLRSPRNVCWVVKQWIFVPIAAAWCSPPFAQQSALEVSHFNTKRFAMVNSSKWLMCVVQKPKNLLTTDTSNFCYQIFSSSYRFLRLYRPVSLWLIQQRLLKKQERFQRSQKNANLIIKARLLG